MSATARNYVYEVTVKKDSEKKQEPTISKEKLAEYTANVEKYLGKRNEN